MMPRQAIASNRQLGAVASKALPPAIGLFVIGVATTFFLAQKDGEGEGGWDRFFHSYLMAFLFILSICLGSLFFVMLGHAVKAGWSIVLRRLAEGVAGNLTWMWVLFLPIMIPVLTGKSHLYHWMHPEGDEVLMAKAGYFFWPQSPESGIPVFWLIRAALFFGVWALLAKFFVGNSVKQDATGDVALTRRMEKFAPPAFILFGLSLAFAAIDWGMSLEPHWFSTMYPVYFFAASCCGFFSLQILLMNFVQRTGRLTTEISAEHYQDAGKLLFAFGIVFWAYIAFSQYMLIWYANIPEETPWYMARQMGGWGWISLLLLFGHFLGPFLMLISRHPKRRVPLITAGAAWMLLMHLTMPKVPGAVHYVGDHVEGPYRALADAVLNPESPAGVIIRGLPEYQPGDLNVNFGFQLLDASCVATLVGLLVAGTIWRLSRASLLAERDPRLHESLAFENI